MTKIVIISDTHEQHDKISLPEGDILIHCGDWTGRGTEPAIEKFLIWFGNQSHSKKIFIAGNHELGLDKGPNRNNKLELIKKYQDLYGIVYLENSGIVIDGLVIWGSPVQPFFFNWAFNVERGQDIKKYWDRIPDNTNILITHGPPFGILDTVSRYSKNLGCEELAKRILELKNLKLSCFGHIHGGQGETKIHDVIFVNASICDEEYKTTNEPIIVEIE